jgi:uncharacterized protein (DUF2141 family)
VNANRYSAAMLLLTCVACSTRSTTPVDVARSAAGVGATVLTVEILGLESDEGSVAVALFSSPESFDQRTGAVATGTVAPQDGRATWSVANLPAGTYAVAVFHDLNDNGELDRTTLGPPAEPYGFSNNARGTFGPPRFESAAIELPPGPHRIKIGVR